MKLSHFIVTALKEMEGLEGGISEFDIAVYPMGKEVYVASEGHPGLSRIRFSIKSSNPQSLDKKVTTGTEEVGNT